MTPEYFRLPAEAVPELRRVITWGLASFAEIQRIQSAMSFNQKHHGTSYSDDVHAASPTCAEDAVGQFASALMWLDVAEELPE